MIKKIFLAVLLLTIVSYSQTEKSSMSDLLASASLISVSIGGNFPVTGSYSASVNERVDQFVTRIYDKAFALALGNSPSQDQINNVRNQFQIYSFRNILLKRKNGEEIKLDLLKFRRTGNFDFNTYLKNDDVLIFPVTDIERNFITVRGAVNNEGTFHFFDGDKLSDALFLAEGVNKAYEDAHQVEISRLSYDGEKMETILVDINSDVELKRGDRVRILATETQRKDYKVLTLGEFNMPGYIPIKKEYTTLKQVIDKAGGFTEHADLSRAQILRGVNIYKSIAFSEEMEQLLMMRMSTLIEEDSTYFRIDEKLRFLRGNANVDFTRLEEITDTLFVLKDGDVIYAPPKIDLIYVYGQVSEPSYVKYEKDKDYNFYLQKAGGLGETASGDIYIIKGKTRTWISVDDVEEKNVQIEPGDYIWASKEPVRTFWEYVDQVARVAVIVTALATIILLFTK
jgi:protein involved in polysaccharide export with SLBB domain